MLERLFPVAEPVESTACLATWPQPAAEADGKEREEAATMRRLIFVGRPTASSPAQQLSLTANLAR